MDILEKFIASVKISYSRSSAMKAVIAILLLFPIYAIGQAQQKANSEKTSDVSKTWLDADTQHRVVRISDEPGSRVSYFNQNAYTTDDKRMVYWAPQGIFIADLTTFKSRRLVAGCIHKSFILGAITPTVYFMKCNDQHLYGIDVDMKYTRQLAELPGHATTISTVNADETLIAGTYLEEANSSWYDFKKEELAKIPSDQLQSLQKSGKLHTRLKYLASEKRQASGTTEVLFTYNLQTGKINTVLSGNDWLNHVQFSPSDTNLLMYCHEGRSSEVQRVWTIHADGKQNKLIHKTAAGEYATHEFWSKDGKTIWYEVGKEKSANGAKKVFLGGDGVETGKQRLYQVGQDQVSAHYASSAKEDMFIGDGTAPASNRWISIMHPRSNSVASDTSSSAATGDFSVEHLVNLSKNNYLKSEPNARLSPDEKWVIFTSDMFGSSYVFAVEIAQTSQK